MNYRKCLNYLEQVQKLGIKFGLEKVQTILSSLDNPHLKFPSLLVAGTNGKGSVCAMLTRILSLHGFRVGLFTSPHLIKVEERIKIGEEEIGRSEFCRGLTLLKEKIEELISLKQILHPPTYFELLTCLALHFFSRKKVDIAVCEVGMGGRFDATNVVQSIVSVITTISHEHQKFLGESLEQIAFEKAGIIRPGVPVVCGVENSAAFEVIKKRALECKAPFIGVFEKENDFRILRGNDKYTFEFSFSGENFTYTPFLAGEHQGKNAAVAIAASLELRRGWKKLDKDRIIQGVESARWEGRLETVSRFPLILIDGAHNEEGALSLKKYIEDFIPPPRVLVFAVMRDKKIERLAEILFPLSEKVVLTSFPYVRAATPEEIREKTLKFQYKLLLEPDAGKALQRAVHMAKAKGFIFVAGSLFLAGEIKKLLPEVLKSFRNFHQSAN